MRRNLISCHDPSILSTRPVFALSFFRLVEFLSSCMCTSVRDQLNFEVHFERLNREELDGRDISLKARLICVV